MALKFHERERLLNDDDDFSGNRISITKNGSSTDLISNVFGSSGSSSFSGLSSVFGSELSSTETESEEEEEGDDEFIAELTRKMADYMLEEDDGKALDTPTEHHSEKLQSTLGSGPTSVPKLNFPAFSDDHSRAVHVYNLENQPSVKHGGGTLSWAGRVKGADLTQQVEQKHKKQHYVQNRGKRSAEAGGGGFGSPAAGGWPTLQQSRQLHKQKQQVRSGSGMSAVFLGGSGSRSTAGSCGTGVFLPRAISNPPEVRKKSECSTVLIPTRVLQALQLHFEDMNTRSQSKGCASFASHPSQHDVAKPQGTNPTVDHNEMDLPQEWTY
ncbi:hypothetical protein RHSIM_Rhsim13G0075900 [Rhododendron simsii]|uniref:Uncharacterized protein n=1 Tax=Rhododendron simsii TaxID=118357 RepID=A0A834L7E4_RHOSS|nr:hypothetical protein RHSIM_Rhsim13G0075900 [Rhododendron simsii]